MPEAKVDRVVSLSHVMSRPETQCAITTTINEKDETKGLQEERTCDPELSNTRTKVLAPGEISLIVNP